MRRGTLAILLLVPAMALAGCLDGGLVGEPAPPFSLVTSDGVTVNESTYLGQFVVLDLMATWCGPCRLEVAHLREVQARFGDRVQILSIGADPGESQADLAAFSERYGATWPHGLDEDGSIARAYQMRIIPKLIVIDPEGVVVFERQGEVLPAAIARVVDPSAAPLEGRSAATTFAVGVLAATLGVLSWMNPYRRIHREGPRASPLALAILLAFALLAYRFSGFVSSRATYGALFGGALTLGAAAWWLRARRKEAAPKEESTWAAVGDRVTEAAPHFALALVLGLSAVDPVGYFVPLVAFLAGAAGGAAAWWRLDAGPRQTAGMAGLLLAGVGLLVFGARILVA